MRVMREPDDNRPVCWTVEHDDGRLIATVRPKVYAEVAYPEGMLISRNSNHPRRDAGNGLDHYIRDSDAALDAIGIETFDWAVPINSDHTYPYGGNAITVYKTSNDRIPCGIVPLDAVWHEYFRQVARLIASEWEE